jgi:flagellar basal-body rod protein FlgB
MNLADLALRKALDGAALRHQAIAENVANADTPGYKRTDVDFATTLKAALGEAPGGGITLARTRPGHLAGQRGGLGEVRPALFRTSDTTARADGNNVDPDREMASLAENTLLYGALTQVLGRRLAMLRSAVNEGRR